MYETMTKGRVVLMMFCNQVFGGVFGTNLWRHLKDQTIVRFEIMTQEDHQFLTTCFKQELLPLLRSSDFELLAETRGHIMEARGE